MKVRTFFLPFYAVSFFTIIVVMVVWSQTVYCISPWPMFRHDLQHNARSIYPGPDEPILKWSFQTDGEVYSSPAIGSDGTIYVGSGDTKLYAINPDGTLKWSYKTGGSVRSSPAIGSDGTIYVGSEDTRIYAINPDGTLRGRFKTNGPLQSSPLVDSSSTVYVGSGDTKVYAIAHDGTLKWSYPTAGSVHSSPIQSLSGGDILVGSCDSKVYKFWPDGTFRWSFQTGGPVYSSLAQRPSNGYRLVYVGSEDGKLYSIDPADGSLLWSYPTDGPVHSSPAVWYESTTKIFVGSADTKLYALDYYGSVMWSYPTGGEIWSSPAMDSDGTLYVGSDDSKVYAITHNGSLKWSFATDGWARSSPAIGADGSIYVGSYDGKVYAIGVRTLGVLRVPSEYPTIQAGIDAAVDGDTVLVVDGYYYVSGEGGIDYKGKAIVVMSENGPEVTVVDGNWHRPFQFQNGEDRNSVLQGFTITGGVDQSYGGGIYCWYASPTIRGNIITGNTAIYGGGIYLGGSSALVEGNIISDNYAYERDSLSDTEVGEWTRLIESSIDSLRKTGIGGGIRIAASSSIPSIPTIRGNVIVANTADWYGGGICCSYYSGIVIEDNLLIDNFAYQFGGGIYCNSSSLIIRRSTFNSNRAYYGDGGGLCCWEGAFPTILDCIFWADSAREGPEIYVHDSSEVTVSYSDIQGGWEGEGNIDSDPLFVTGSCGDFYLSQHPCQDTASPCVDAGDPTSLVPLGTTQSCHEVADVWPVDMGYHYPCLEFYVTPDTTTVERGGQLGYTVEIANNTCGYKAFSYWSDVYLWTGAPYKRNPVLGPKWGTFKPGKKKSTHITHEIPQNAPLKTYTLYGRIGYHAYEIWDEDCFEFTLIEPREYELEVKSEM